MSKIATSLVDFHVDRLRTDDAPPPLSLHPHHRIESAHDGDDDDSDDDAAAAGGESDHDHELSQSMTIPPIHIPIVLVVTKDCATLRLTTPK